MVTFKGIAVTDEINLYNEIFSLQAMFGAYEKQWNELMPSFANHNHTKSIGYSKLTGLFIEPKKAYATNAFCVPENEAEEKKIREYNYNHLYQVHITENIDKYNCLIEKANEYIIGECKKYWTNGVYIQNKGIVSRMFPDLTQHIQNGLIDIKLLTPVLPGIYRIGDYLIFAHRYFRRGYSYLNTLNTAFLSRIEELSKGSVSTKIAIDMDCIGLAGTEHKEFEYAYWWGPKFNNDLNSIPLGVTRHENEHYNELLSEIRSTEFGWYIQDNKHTFECEEITDIPNLSVDHTDMYACRFVHSMVDKDTGMPDHLDGAIRAYTTEKMIERLDISIKESDRDTVYTKIWRIDGDISVETWKELIAHYYRDNMMVGEYFGGIDDKLESRIEKDERPESRSVSIKQFIPCTINSGYGIRINLSFSEPQEINEKYDVYIRAVNYVVNEEIQNKYVESEAFSLYKLLKRNGLNVRFPNMKQVSYNDLVYNYPVFECINTDSADIIVNSIKTLCYIWEENGDDRVISFTIKVPCVDKVATFSFLGHIKDFIKYFDAGFNYIPAENKIYNWLKESYDFISTHFSNVHDVHPFDILKSNGLLSVARCFVPSQCIESINNDGKATFILPKDDLDFICKNKISAVIAFIDEKKKCSKCKTDYALCNCISTLDDDVFEIIEKALPLGLTWTNRSAFI